MRNLNSLARKDFGVGMLKGKGVALALALAFMAASVLGASAMLLMNTVAVNVQEPVTVGAITDNYPARTAASRTYSSVITIDFTKGGFVAGDVAHVKVELVVVDPRIGDFQSFTVEVYKGSTLVATVTKSTPVDTFTETVPNPPAAVSYDVKITFQTGKTAINAFTTKLNVQVIYVE